MFVSTWRFQYQSYKLWRSRFYFRLFDGIYSSSLFPLITKPIRTSNTSHSFLDFIFAMMYNVRDMSMLWLSLISLIYFPVFTINSKYQKKSPILTIRKKTKETIYKYGNYNTRNVQKLDLNHTIGMEFNAYSTLILIRSSQKDLY